MNLVLHLSKKTISQLWERNTIEHKPMRTLQTFADLKINRTSAQENAKKSSKAKSLFLNQNGSRNRTKLQEGNPDRKADFSYRKAQ